MAVVWEGSKSLRRSLRAIESLDPFPGNPRRGDVPAIRASLRRFGQVKPILVDGDRIVAGHHLVLAAVEEGWTHVAATANEFASEDEARAFLLADNRTAELGGFDVSAVNSQLEALRDAGVSWEGTGYGQTEYEKNLALLNRPLEGDTTKREHRDPAMKEVVLIYSADDLKDFQSWVEVVAREAGIDGGVSVVVLQALRRLAASF